jgi:acyl-CoA synthetase (NDP forming)
MVINIYARHYQEKIFNPHSVTVCVASVQEINSTIDLAIITTPSRIAPSILEQCGKQKFL